MSTQPKRLAFVISGAVSLGSYEAGVLYEVLRALGQHNRRVTDPAQRIEIDVMVGASAGSMSAAITAQVLVGGSERLAGAHANPFYQAWVRDVDLAGLLKVRPGDRPSDSLLSGEFIDQLSLRHLGTVPAGTPHPAAPAHSGRLRLAFALSNLRGVDYDSVTQGTAHPYTRFQDEWRSEIMLAAPGAADWTAIRQAAVASGSFPAAFPVRWLRRNRRDYYERMLAGWPAAETSREFPYSDGGVFNNEPLGLAKEMVDAADRHLNVDSRFYLFVAPNPKLSAQSTALQPDNTTLFKTGQALINALLGQAQYQDLRALDKTNQRVSALNRTAETLARTLGSDPSAAASLRATAPVFTQLAFGPGGGESLAAAQTRLCDQFKSEPWFPAGPAVRDPWCALLAAFERAANLQEKDEMRLLNIGTSDAVLMGDPLVHFGGFTCEAVRHHDYEVGRARAQEWLRAQMAPPADEPHPFGPLALDGQFEPARPDRPAAARELARIIDQVTDQLDERARERLHSIMKEAGLGGLKRWAVDKFVIGSKIADTVRAQLTAETKPPTV